MNPKVQSQSALLYESMQVSGQLLLIRLRLKTVTDYEKDRLNMRAEYLRKLIQETKE